MTKRMLIDATHAEETRVVVLDGNRLDDYDVETANRKQLKGNIYLAKVVRVEPSLQAAFVEYGGNRHGFLAFGEIHPDYYQIPVADRQRLIELQEEEARAEEAAEEAAASGVAAAPPEPPAPDAGQPEQEPALDAATEAAADAAIGTAIPAAIVAETVAEQPTAEADPEPSLDPASLGADLAPEAADAAVGPETVQADAAPPETVGGDHDAAEEARERRVPPRFLRNYKIQEVIRRRQILLVQVVKEERGTKGAALTTYISLAGRYCVLMPNSPRGGGISRKITSAADRKRLREAMTEMEIPRGMGLIVRTAGANRPKAEIKRDCEYLLRLWDDIRERTLQSVAPTLIYEEASLIKRAIRDVYSRDVDEVVVDGEDGWRAARDFMRMLMPSHARKVQLWKDTTAGGGQKLFARSHVEGQLDAMLAPTVQLKSGGYLVINQTEALVAIDVNSGRSTRERGIEETALRTNQEAADEVARQLRLRDLAGLIVIDFIDMEAKKHNAMVERRLKEALKTDRARIQVGHISHFGLMEMSRQRLRPSLAETSFSPCPHCGGTGHVRSIESAAMHVLRAIEEEAAKHRAAEVLVHVAGAIALYILNHKRAWLAEVEALHGMRVAFAADDALIPPQIRIDRLRALTPAEAPPPVTVEQRPAVPAPEDTEAAETEAETEETEPATEAEAAPAGEEGDRRRRRRRRRRRGGRREDGAAPPAGETEAETAGAETASEAEASLPEAPATMAPPEEAAPAIEATPDDQPQPVPPEEPGVQPTAEAAPSRRRRPRRSRSRDREPVIDTDTTPPAEPTPYVGPTPADPYAGAAFDLFEMAEGAPEAQPPLPPPQAAQESPEPAPIPLPPEQAPQPEIVAAPEETEPAIKPIVVGTESEPLREKKRGWWRR